MTFAQIQTRVADRLNLTSTAALTRIMEELNERYKEVMSSIGLNSCVRVPLEIEPVVGDRLLGIECEKVFSIYDDSVSPRVVVTEISWDEMQKVAPSTGVPRKFAVSITSGTTVTVQFDNTPETIYAFTADVQVTLDDLTGTGTPSFPGDFHDILTRGVMADELYKMEKYDLSNRQEAKFEKRLSDLKFFLAKSTYLDVNQGKVQ